MPSVHTEAPTLFNGDGSPAGVEFLVNQAGVDDQSVLSVTALSHGRFAIKVRVFDNDGTPASDEFLVNDEAAADQFFRHLAHQRSVPGRRRPGGQGTALRPVQSGDRYGRRRRSDGRNHTRRVLPASAAVTSCLASRATTTSTAAAAGITSRAAPAATLWSVAAATMWSRGEKATTSCGARRARTPSFFYTIQTKDTIKDYNPFQDTILLAESAFASLEFGQLADSQFRVGATAADGNDYLVYDPTNGEPRYDPDGNGVLASALIAKLPAGLTITADEFFVG